MSNHENGGGQASGSDSNRFIETGEIDADFNGKIEFDVGDDSELDEAFLQAWKATIALETLGEALLLDKQGMANFPYDVGDRDEYELAVARGIDCGTEILERAADNSAIRRDLSRLDPALLREARASLVYAAGHLGLDVDLPAPEGGS